MTASRGTLLMLGGCVTMSNNNWLRRLMYFFGVRRFWIRKI